MAEIIIQREVVAPIDLQITTIEQHQKRRIMRRRRVAKRLAKRFPLFAVEMMQAEFPGYTYEMFEADLSRKSRKEKSIRHIKSPLKRQGRYPLLQKAMTNYRLTGDVEFLAEAQRWRNRLYLPFEVWFKLGKETKVVTLPSTASLQLIERLSKITFKSWEEWDEQYNEIMKWSHIN